MLLGEIIKTCSHEKVAQAAVASLGADFQKRIDRAARERGMRSGIFVASAVRCFGRSAGDDEWAGLARAMERKDMPILSGLRHILELTLSEQKLPYGNSAYGRTSAGVARAGSAWGLGCEA